MEMEMYMYDVRGIQDYIFRTNKVKEIIGASQIVDDKIIDLFEKACKKQSLENVEYDYESEKLSFFEDSSIDAEIFYYGGGNLLVLYRNKEIGEAVSKNMRIALVKETYSLQLAVAHVPVEGNETYKEDYKALRKEMERVKANMPMVQPISGFPITANDPITGFPFSEEFNNQRVTRETKSKLEKTKTDEFDSSFGTTEGNSLVAIVHIDGNSMGQTIRNIMGGVSTYTDAAKKMRKLSKEIKTLFEEKALDRAKEKVSKKDTLRKIIGAGDDITFICNAKDALSCVLEFFKTLKEDGKYNACAGIYITHLKAPFSRGYEYAEELCSNAKKHARKAEEHCSNAKKHDGKKGGCYLDFQVNYSGAITDIDTMRSNHYQSIFKKEELEKRLYERPYFYDIEEGSKGAATHVCKLIEMLNKIDKDSVARSKVKGLRESFMMGNEIVKTELGRIDSRLADKLDIDEEEYRILFDAIDVMDLEWGGSYE